MNQRVRVIILSMHIVVALFLTATQTVCIENNVEKNKHLEAIDNNVSTVLPVTDQSLQQKKSKPPVWVAPLYVPANKRIMENMYHGITGFIKLSPEERASIESGYTKKTSTYGEIPYDSFQVILDNEHFGPNDVVYDLGCGVGKVVLQVYLNTAVKKVQGIELSTSRYVGADAMMKKFKKTDAYKIRVRNGKQRRKFTCVKGDFLKANLNDATIIYMCSTCFPPELMDLLIEKFKKINRLGLRIITLKEFSDHEKHGFRFEREYHLPMSWSKTGRTSPVYVYSYAGNIFN